MKTKPQNTPSDSKIRRDARGGKRGDGDRRLEPRQRPDPHPLHAGAPDASLSQVGGLVPFGQWLQQQGVDDELAQRIAHLKDSPWTIYPMEGQLRLLLDALVAGESRVFGLEGLAADPLFVHLAGGVVPSLDTVYRDLARFGMEELLGLEQMMFRHALWPGALRDTEAVHLDPDTTVQPLFGQQQGARPGPNPRYRGRPSYPPIVMRLAETGTYAGALLRPGDTALGDAEAGVIEAWIHRLREQIATPKPVYVRIDAAGDCTAIMEAIARQNAYFVIKASMQPELMAAVAAHDAWHTVDADADGKPLRQVAEIPFRADAWKRAGLPVRVVAVRTREPTSGKQIHLWEELDYNVKVYLTHDFVDDLDSVARRYEDRAEVEVGLDELKHDFGLGCVPSQLFGANHAMLLLKMLGANLVRQFVARFVPALKSWRMSWLRRVLWCVPVRLLRSARRHIIRPPPGSLLQRMLN